MQISPKYKIISSSNLLISFVQDDILAVINPELHRLVQAQKEANMLLELGEEIGTDMHGFTDADYMDMV